MSGELWRSQFQIGKESTAGTGVAATRKMYFDTDGSMLKREREARPRKFAVGSRDNTRAFTLGNTQVSGSIKMPLSASEIIELLLMTVKGGVSPTGAGTAKLWTFTPGETLDPATLEWNDGANVYEANGVYGSKLSIDGSVDGGIDVSADLFGMKLETSSLTGSLTERTPDFIEGWETKLYVDAFGGTPGSTAVTGTLINWKVEIDNQPERKYFANNTQDADAIPLGEIMVNATLTFEANSATSVAEFANWDAATKRLVRLEFGQNEVIDGSDKAFVTIDVPGAWSAFNLSGNDKGTRTYELSLEYVYDPTNAFGLQIRAQNARATAW